MYYFYCQSPRVGLTHTVVDCTMIYRFHILTDIEKARPIEGQALADRNTKSLLRKLLNDPLQLFGIITALLGLLFHVQGHGT